MSDANEPKPADATEQTPSEDQQAAEMEEVQKEAAIEREEDGGYQ